MYVYIYISLNNSESEKNYQEKGNITENKSANCKVKCWKFPLYLLHPHPHWDNCLQRATEQCEPNIHLLGDWELEESLWVFPSKGRFLRYTLGSSQPRLTMVVLWAGQCLDEEVRDAFKEQPWCGYCVTELFIGSHGTQFSSSHEGREPTTEQNPAWWTNESYGSYLQENSHSDKNDSKTAT